jgi:hypothetical protein
MNHIPKIIIKPVEPENQRYNTVGDYIYDAEDDTMIIFVSRMSNWRSELAVAIHELFESTKCLADDLDFREIDMFDMTYEKFREPEDLTSEPGDSTSAPYHSQHVAATFVEREACSKLGLAWLEHEKIVNEE